MSADSVVVTRMLLVVTGNVLGQGTCPSCVGRGWIESPCAYHREAWKKHRKTHLIKRFPEKEISLGKELLREREEESVIGASKTCGVFSLSCKLHKRVLLEAEEGIKAIKEEGGWKQPLLPNGRFLCNFGAPSTTPRRCS